MLIGFIGVGQMGGGLARNLIRAGKNVLIYDINPDAIAKTLAVGNTGKAVADLNEMAQANVIFTSLPLPEHVQEIMLGKPALYSKLKPGSVHIEVSTIDPGTARYLYDAAESKGLDYLQCPLGKTPAHAEKAEVPIFVGGRKEVYERYLDLLQVVGKPVYIGSVEASSAFKLISNLIGMTNLVVLAEGIRIGEKAGIDRKLLLELLNDTGAKSFQLDVRGPWIVDGDFANRFGLNLALKDMRLGCQMAAVWGNDAKTMQVALDYFKNASSAGYDQEDCSAVYKVIR